MFFFLVFGRIQGSNTGTSALTSIYTTRKPFISKTNSFITKSSKTGWWQENSDLCNKRVGMKQRCMDIQMLTAIN